MLLKLDNDPFKLHQKQLWKQPGAIFQTKISTAWETACCKCSFSCHASKSPQWTRSTLSLTCPYVPWKEETCWVKAWPAYKYNKSTSEAILARTYRTCTHKQIHQQNGCIYNFTFVYFLSSLIWRTHWRFSAAPYHVSWPYHVGTHRECECKRVCNLNMHHSCAATLFTWGQFHFRSMYVISAGWHLWLWPSRGGMWPAHCLV